MIIAYVWRQTEALQRGVESFHSDLAERASDALGNIALIQSFTRIDAEVSNLRDVATRVIKAQIPVLTWWAIVSVLTRSATTITIIAIFVVGTWLHIQGLASIGEIVMFVSIATMFVGKLEQAVGVCEHGRARRAAPRGILLECSIRRRMYATSAARSISAASRARSSFENVSLSYDGKRAAVADLTFDVKPGETVAIVGETGAGKSTALSLIHRAFDPQTGVVRVDGHDIRDVKLASLRQNVGVVFQEALLFNRSIEENLRVGKKDATFEELSQAVERAQASEFIERTPAGLAANVGERGRHAVGRRTSAHRDCARAAEGPADPDP